MKDNGKNSFVIYHDIEKALNLLTDEQCGKLFKASVKYSSCGATPEFNDPTIDVAFAFIRNAIDGEAIAGRIFETCGKGCYCIELTGAEKNLRFAQF